MFAYLFFVLHVNRLLSTRHMKSEKVLFKKAFFFKKVLDLLLGEAFFQFAQRDPEHVLDGLDGDGEGVCNFLLLQSLHT